MAKITILVTSELDRDPRVQKEARSAAEAGYDVLVICRSYEGPDMPYRVIQSNIGRHTHILAKIAERSWTNIWLFYKAIKNNADIVHANDLDTLPAGYLAAKVTGAKILYDAHELWSEASAGGSQIRKFLAVTVERILSRRVEAVVAANSYRAEIMAETLGIRLPTVVMNVPNYKPPNTLTTGDWVKQFKGRKIVLYQGRYSPNMGLEDAILAFKSLPKDIVLVFRGFGSLEENLREIVRDEDMKDQIYFVAPVLPSQMVSSAVGADLGLVTYLPVNRNNLYAAPNKLFEFIMAGIPCVGSDLPLIRDILVGYGLGKVFQPGEPEDIALAVTESLTNHQELDEMKRRCQQYGRLFSWETEGVKLIEEYNRILVHASAT